jgi:CubicO group peptidase (beta-lactamase class C family)
VSASALALVWAVALEATAPPASPAPASTSDALASAQVAAIDKAIGAAMTRLGIPGLTAAVALGPGRIWTQGYGLADIENEVPATEQTMYRLASVSKPMTAVAVLQLVEHGKVDLNTPVQRYVPAFPAKPWPITPRLLLTHQSGVRHWNGDEWTMTRHFKSLSDALAIFKDDALLFEPGTQALYSSPGYNLLGSVIEGASGKDFLTYMRESVFVPAGMESTRNDDALDIIPHRAEGYARRENGELRNSVLSDTSNKVPGGGLISTAADVARFGAALLDGKLLQKGNVSRMCTCQKTRKGQITEYGLGVHVTETKKLLECWHQGGQPEVSTLVYMRPRSHITVALLCNLEGVSTALVDLAREIANVVR